MTEVAAADEPVGSRRNAANSGRPANELLA